MTKRTFSGARALVTGASSGIGRALATRLVERGASVGVLARREEASRSLVDELNGRRAGSAFYLVGDVTDASARSAAIAAVRERFGGLDALFNNAGAGATLRCEATSESLARELFELNFFAPFELAKAAFPSLVASAKSAENRAARIRPIIVNLSSIVGLRGTPHYGVYGAAKSALATLADAWRAEAKAVGIDFLTVAPGTTATEFFDVLRENRSQPFFPAHRRATPESVATAILDAAERGKNRIIPHFPSRILDRLTRFAPGFVDYLMSRYAGPAE